MRDSIELERYQCELHERLRLAHEYGAHYRRTARLTNLHNHVCDLLSAQYKNVRCTYILLGKDE